MHYTALPKFHLSKFHPGMKILLSMYLGSVLVGLVVSFLMFTSRADLSYDGAIRHYQGDEAISDESREAMDAESDILIINMPMSATRIIEILHPHMFSVPLVLLVICHLFALTNAPHFVKISCYFGSFGGFVLTFGGMWIATMSGFGVWLLFIGGAAFFVTSTWMCIASIGAAWFGKPKAKVRAEPPAAGA